MKATKTAPPDSAGKVTLRGLRDMKQQGRKIAMLTAYDYLTARLMDQSGIDIILVGDSAGNVVFGYESTVETETEALIYLTRAVARGVERALVVGDMPFASFRCGSDAAMRHACAFIQAGAGAVKMEGGGEVIDLTTRMVRFGIPVMGHLGLLPQSVRQSGGYRVCGRSEQEAHQILEDALHLEDAGAFALVLELVPGDLGRKISERVAIPTIGIGAGPGCDGQVLTGPDMLGMNTDFEPKFLRRYEQFDQRMTAAFQTFIRDVQEGKFPGPEESY